MNDVQIAQSRTIAPGENGVLRAVQLTDCHILETPGERLYTVDTRRSLEAICRAVAADVPGLDLLLATGDLSQDGSAASYRYLAKCFDAFGVPTFCLPGNHDDVAAMAEHLRAAHLHPEKIVLAGAWVIVLLDSTLAGEVYGRVADAELDFMDSALHRHAGRHALVCLHHQARDVGSRWIDRIGLPDSERLRARLARHAGVRGVLWGHVHQEYRVSSGGIDWMGSPSTCAQFLPGADEFALDDRAPGYRLLELYPDGRISSRVERPDERTR